MTEAKVTTLIDMKGKALAPRTVASAVTTANGKSVEEALADNTGSVFELLWTNPSPTSNFAAQTISLDLSSYTFIGVYYEFQPNDGYGRLFFGIKDIKTHCTLNQNTRVVRHFMATDTGVAFEVGKAAWYNASLADSNAYMIPRYIYGIK